MTDQDDDGQASETAKAALEADELHEEVRRLRLKTRARDLVDAERNGVAGDDDESGSWAPVDLGPYLRGEIARPEPTVGLRRSDGLRVLYPGREHACIGEMESGKSWINIACTAAELTAGHHVVYVHFEESDPSDTLERLRALGVSSADMTARLKFVGPERRVSSAALAELLEPAPSLVVLDGVNEAMSLHNWPIREEDGAALFRRHLVKPCTRVGAATLAADHVVKDAERRGRSAIGSVHKVNGLSGVLLQLENAEPFGRGQRGRSHVYVTKDRPGHLRRHGRATAMAGRTFIGELVVDDTESWSPDLQLRFWAPRDEQGDVECDQPTVADLVHEVLGSLPERTAGSERQLFAAMRSAGHKLRNQAMRDGADDLVAAGRAEEIVGRNRARGYRASGASPDDRPQVLPTGASASASPKEGDAGTHPRGSASGRTGTHLGRTEKEAQ